MRGIPLRFVAAALGACVVGLTLVLLATGGIPVSEQSLKDRAERLEARLPSPAPADLADQERARRFLVRLESWSRSLKDAPKYQSNRDRGRPWPAEARKALRPYRDQLTEIQDQSEKLAEVETPKNGYLDLEAGRDAVNFFLAYARARVEEGDDRGAVDELRRAMAVTRDIDVANANLIGTMLAHSLESLLLFGLRDMVVDAPRPVSHAELSALFGVLSEEEHDAAARRAFESEARATCRMLRESLARREGSFFTRVRENRELSAFISSWESLVEGDFRMDLDPRHVESSDQGLEVAFRSLRRGLDDQRRWKRQLRLLLAMSAERDAAGRWPYPDQLSTPPEGSGFEFFEVVSVKDSVILRPRAAGWREERDLWSLGPEAVMQSR